MPAGFLKHRQPFDVGRFRVMPFLNDHSAFDAYSMLIGAGGRRLFYTGDIRGHGRKKDIFAELLRDPPSDVDVLLMEGNEHPAWHRTCPGDSHRDRCRDGLRRSL